MVNRLQTIRTLSGTALVLRKKAAPRSPVEGNGTPRPLQFARAFTSYRHRTIRLVVAANHQPPAPSAMMEPCDPILVLTTPEALPQRVPPAERVRERSVRLAAGDELDPEWLRATLVDFEN